MNLSSVLKAGKKIPVDDFFDLMWGRKIASQYGFAEYDGTLPATYRANGDYLADYRIYGAVGGVGDVTAQLFDVAKITANKYLETTTGALNDTQNSNTSAFIEVNPNDTYTIAWGKNGALYSTADREILFFYAKGTNPILALLIPVSSGQTSFSFTVPSNATYIRFDYDKSFVDIMLTEGSTAPTSYVPPGYEADMSVENWSPYVTHSGKIIDTTTGDENSAAQYTTAYFNNFFPSTAVISVKADTAGGGRALRYVPYDANQVPMLEYKMEKNFVRDGRVAQLIVTIPSGAAYYGVSYHNGDTQKKISTATPIYIGDNPLGEDEYVNYGEGKIYRMSGGVLIPTDPPAPLPALPTVDGTNIVDYAGQSAAPSRFYAKYRKG